MQSSHLVVSVNLLTWNGQKYIKDCLDSVFNQTYPYLEILIIDNGSTDGTKDFLKDLDLKKKDLRVIFNQENIGFAAGHNQGIKETKGELILCLNQDIVLDRDFIRKAVMIFEKDKKIATVQGKLLRWSKGLSLTDNSVPYQIAHIIDTTGFIVLKNRRIINREQGQIDQGQLNKIEEIFGADGAAPIYRREALEDVKLNNEYFDEDFFSYKEDVDLAWRLRLFDWKAIYCPEAIAWHDRTAGDSIAKNYWDIIKERLKISKFGKYLAFKNQRLMQLKNEQVGLLLKHSPWFLSKEIASWIYVLLFEKYTWQAIKALFKQMPRAWQKRKLVMAKKRVKAKEMGKWFQ